MKVEEGPLWPEASSQSLVWKNRYFLSSMGFTKSKADPYIYLKVVEDELIILLLYVDDLSLTGNEK